MNAHETWLQARRTGIGGSDVAAILGLSKWKTPLQVYQEKRGELGPQADNDAMRWGRYLEPVVRQAYADETGREVRVPTDMLRSQVHDWMVANVDGIAGVGSQADPFRVFEAKTARTAEGWGESGSDQIPQPYLLQVQHYLYVTALHIADVAVLIGGSDFRLYEVPADRELQDMLVDAEAEFWQRVQKGEPPEPVTVADAVARWGRASRAEMVPADDETMRAVAALRELKVQREHLDMAEEQWKAIVMRTLGERDTLVGPDGKTLCTWKASAAPKRFDTAAFRAAHPDLAEQFTKAGEPSRRFLLKG
jgi:putative phage-type endonuclease